MESPTPSPDRAFQLLGSMMNSFILSALINNEVFEAIDSGTNSLEELALTCNLNENVLRRTLRFASFVDLVSISGSRYQLNDVSRCFLKNTPGSLYGSARFISAPP